MSDLDDRIQKLMVDEGLSEEGARQRAQLELAVDYGKKAATKPSASKPKRAKPTGQEKHRQLSEEERRRLADRFTWKAGDITVIKRGKRKP